MIFDPFFEVVIDQAQSLVLLPTPQPGSMHVVRSEDGSLQTVDSDRVKTDVEGERWGPVRSVYEVDVTERPLRFRGDFIAKNGGAFRARITMACRVRDAAAVVRRNIHDASRVLRPPAIETVRSVCQEFSDQELARAESAAASELQKLASIQSGGFDTAFTVTTIIIRLVVRTSWPSGADERAEVLKRSHETDSLRGWDNGFGAVSPSSPSRPRNGGEGRPRERIQFPRSPSLAPKFGFDLAPSDGPKSPPTDTELPPSRTPSYVTTRVTEGSDGRAIEGALVFGSAYAVRVRLGPTIEDSILPAEESEVHVGPIEANGAWLRAVLDLDFMPKPFIAPFVLRADGRSAACSCPYGSREHLSDCDPQEWVIMPFTVPTVGDRALAQLALYRDAVALHVQEIDLSIGQGPAPSARLVARLTQEFTDVDGLERRSASIVVSSASRVMVNGLGFTQSPFSITAGPADTAVLNSRQTLYAAHMQERGGRAVNLYRSDLSKDRDEFRADLARLARNGSDLYTRLFQPTLKDPQSPFTLPALLRHEAELRGRPPILQISDPQFSDQSVLWQTVYDFPLGGDETRYNFCPSLDELDQLTTAGDPAPICPYAQRHKEQYDVLCPWGFWGLSAYLESPTVPARGTSLGDYTQSVKERNLFLATGPRLERTGLEEHLQQLAKTIGSGSLDQSKARSAADLARSLAPEGPDVVYFYCHCGYRTDSMSAGADRYLDLPDYVIYPMDVSGWARATNLWPRPHWPTKRPLILLNGCHTSEVTSRTLNSFVDAFTVWAGAAGVIGTEITLDQGVAAWIGARIVQRLWGGATVASALRSIRWELLAKGNLMGLAYTPFCHADLALTS